MGLHSSADNLLSFHSRNEWSGMNGVTIIGVSGPLIVDHSGEPEER